MRLMTLPKSVLYLSLVGLLTIFGTQRGHATLPTPLPTPEVIWQAVPVETNVNNDIDEVVEDTSYHVHWGYNIEDWAYGVQRRKEGGAFLWITPTPVFVDDGNGDGYFYFEEEDTLDPGWYYYKITSPSESNPRTDEGTPAPGWIGGIHVVTPTYTPTPTHTFTNTPTFTPTHTFTPTPTPTPVHRVKHNATGAGDGSSWTDAYTTISAALTAANSGEWIWVAAGTYEESITLVDGVKVYGGFEGITTETELSHRDLADDMKPIIDGEGTAPHVVIGADNALLDGFVITGGGGGEYGGGVYCDGTEPTIKNCIIRDNEATYGGGIYCGDGGDAVFENCLVVTNTSTESGGGAFFEDSSPSLEHCTVAANEKTNGHCGGIHLVNSDAAITNSIIWNDSGSEIYIDSGDPIVSYCCIHSECPFGTSIIRDSPQFNGWVDGGFQPLEDSPCVDAGDSTSISTDIIGNSRSYDGTPDMGAYEWSGVDPEEVGSPKGWDIDIYVCKSGSNYEIHAVPVGPSPLNHDQEVVLWLTDGSNWAASTIGRGGEASFLWTRSWSSGIQGECSSGGSWNQQGTVDVSADLYVPPQRDAWGNPILPQCPDEFVGNQNFGSTDFTSTGGTCPPSVATPTNTLTPSNTPTATSTPTDTPTETPTFTPTNTDAPTATFTPTPTNTMYQAPSPTAPYASACNYTPPNEVSCGCSCSNGISGSSGLPPVASSNASSFGCLDGACTLAIPRTTFSPYGSSLSYISGRDTYTNPFGTSSQKAGSNLMQYVKKTSSTQVDVYVGGAKYMTLNEASGGGYFESDEGSSTGVRYVEHDAFYIFGAGVEFKFADPFASGDDHGLLEELTVEETGETHVYTYDSVNPKELDSIDSSEETTDTVLTWSSGKLEKIDYPNGTTEDFLYDTGTLSGVEETNGSDTISHVEWDQDTTNDLIEKIYDYDPTDGTTLLNTTTYSWDTNDEIEDYTDFGGEYTISKTTSPESVSITAPDNGVSIVTLSEDTPVTGQTTLTQETKDGSTILLKAEIVTDDDHGGILTTTVGDPLQSDDFEIEYTYNVDDLLEMVISPEGNYVKLSYDDPNDNTLVTRVGRHKPHPDNTEVLYTSYEYDSEGRVEEITEGGGGSSFIRSTLEYNEEGRLEFLTDANQILNTYSYDDENNEFTVSSNGATWTIEYDDENRLEAISSPLGKETFFEYDPLTGHLENSYADHAGNNEDDSTTFEYEFGGVGEGITAVIDGEGREVAYEYDGYGRLEKEILDDGTNQYEWVRDYDTVVGDRVDKETDPKGQYVEYEYDKAGLTTKETYYDSGDNHVGEQGYDYDSAGKLDVLSVKDCATCNTDQFAFYYTDNGLLDIRDSFTVPGFVGGTINYDYDDIDRLESITYPDASGSAGTEVEYTYLGFQPLYQVLSPIGNAEYYFGGYNRLESIKRRHGSEDLTGYKQSSSTSFGYDGGTGQIDRVSHVYGSGRLDVQEYEYDDDGLIDDRTRYIRSKDGDEDLWVDYEYTDLNQLKKEIGYEASDLQNPVYQYEYAYDHAGNRTRIAKSGSAIGWEAWWLNYNDLNQLVNRHINVDNDVDDGHEGSLRWVYDYDDNGNLIEAIQEKSLSSTWTQQLEWQYEWDVHDNLIEARRYDGSGATYAGKVEYVYSPVVGAGRTERIEYNSSNAITSWVRYEIDGLQVLRVDEKYDSNSSSTITSADGWRIRDRRTHSPALIGGLLFKEVYSYPSATSNANSTSKVYYYGYDAQGNVSVITEEYCGGTAEQFIFTQDAFGNELTHGIFERSSWSEAAEAGITEHQTGKDLDQFTGLYYFGARWYDPAVGRFVSRSPLPPDIEGAYLYCENDPINNVDVNGRISTDTLEIISNYSAGYADNLTLGVTGWLRNRLAEAVFGESIETVDKCSVSYLAGGLTDLLASGGLKGASLHLLRKFNTKPSRVKELIKDIARNDTYGHYPINKFGNRYGWEVHHINTLSGYPDRSTSLFPSAALPLSIHGHRRNLMRVKTSKDYLGLNRIGLNISEHDFVGFSAKYTERTVGLAIDPLSIGIRAGFYGANGLMNCF